MSDVSLLEEFLSVKYLGKWDWVQMVSLSRLYGTMVA